MLGSSPVSRLENSDMKVLDFNLDGLTFFRDSSPQKFLSSERRGLYEKEIGLGMVKYPTGLGCGKYPTGLVARIRGLHQFENLGERNGF